MRWEGRRQSDNVEDRRSQSPGGGGMLLGGGIGTVIVVVIVLLMGGNPQQLLENMGNAQQQAQSAPHPASAEEDRQLEFVKTVLADTEDVWDEQFRLIGKSYVKPKLVAFSGRVRSGCGVADASMGPFYCPADQTVYIDLKFFNELRNRFGAAGDFAQAYVIAHEVGHHVQKLLGVSDAVHNAQQNMSQAEANELSVRLELQADFYAGVWARKGNDRFKFLEEGDIEEALNAANAIGDDKIQRQATGEVRPDSFTHGSSDQRVRWFRKGFETGDIRQGDTFRTRNL